MINDEDGGAVSIIYQIKEKMNSLTKTQKKIAAFLLENPHEVIYYNTDKLVSACQVSHAAISRFCYLFNFYGLKDLQIALAREISLADERTFEVPESEKFAKDISRNVLTQMTLALKDTYHLVNQTNYNHAAALLLAASKIQLIGIGASELVALDLMQKLMRIQKNAYLYQDADLRKIGVLQLTKNDVLVAISYSGEKTEIIKIVEQANHLNIPVIAIVKTGDTKLAERATICLEVAAFEKNFRLGALSSRIAQLYAVDVLFYSCTTLLGTEKMAALQKTYQIVREE